MTTPRVDVHLTDDDLEVALRADVRAGLTATPKALPPKWFYDHRGSELFDRITRLAEYYPTRREREILEREAPAIAGLGADTLIELGSGSSEKTRVLLDAMAGPGLRRYVPFDVSESFLRQSATALAAEYPDLDIHAVAGDFEHHLGHLPVGGTRVIALLGGTIGNLDPLERKQFLQDLRATMEVGDRFLLGTDLVKDPARLVAAYDDAEGVTADFNRNVLRVINRELGADFAIDSFEHEAHWSPDDEWIEMRLRARQGGTVTVSDLALSVDFAPGELMRTEISSKFRDQPLADELGAAGFDRDEFWTDRAGDFALSLSRAV